MLIIGGTDVWVMGWKTYIYNQQRPDNSLNQKLTILTFSQSFSENALLPSPTQPPHSQNLLHWHRISYMLYLKPFSIWTLASCQSWESRAAGTPSRINLHHHTFKMGPQRCLIWRWLVLSIFKPRAHRSECYLQVHFLTAVTNPREHANHSTKV